MPKKNEIEPARAMGELAVPKIPGDLLSLSLNPDQVIDIATTMANKLARMIKDLQLYTNIKGKHYAHVEAWTTMGSMLGIVALEESSRKTDDITWETTVVLKRLGSDQIVGRASHICSKAEKSKKFWDEYAIKSMSATRATGKAFRLSYSWIMTLAGYEACPKEEMDQVIDVEDQPPFENQNTEKKEPPAKKAADVPMPDMKDIYTDTNYCKIQLANMFKNADLFDKAGLGLFAEWLAGQRFSVAADFIHLMKWHKLTKTDLPVVANEIKEMEIPQIESFIIRYSKEVQNAQL